MHPWRSSDDTVSTEAELRAGDRRLAQPAGRGQGHRCPRRPLPQLHRALARSCWSRPPAPTASCDVSPKGDAPGFVLVLDERRLLIPDRPGNKRLDGMQQPAAEPARWPDLPHPRHGGDAARERPRPDRARRGAARALRGPRQGPDARHRRRGGGGLHPLRQGLQALGAVGAGALARRSRTCPRRRRCCFDHTRSAGHHPGPEERHALQDGYRQRLY